MAGEKNTLNLGRMLCVCRDVLCVCVCVMNVQQIQVGRSVIDFRQWRLLHM